MGEEGGVSFIAFFRVRVRKGKLWRYGKLVGLRFFESVV